MVSMIRFLVFSLNASPADWQDYGYQSSGSASALEEAHPSDFTRKKYLASKSRVRVPPICEGVKGVPPLVDVGERMEGEITC